MFPVEKLYHATRAENLESIMRDGLRASFHGAVHGEMDYAPAGPSVYLSRHEFSSNLHGALFAGPDGERFEVVVLEIDPSLLDPDLVYPDDSMLYAMDEAVLCDWDDEDEGERAATVIGFANRYGIDIDRARSVIEACHAEGEARYPHILKGMWRELLSVEGEIAYLGDVPAAAILGVKPYGMERRREDPEREPAWEP